VGKGIVSIPNLRAKDAMVRKQIYVRTIVMLNEPKRLIGSTQRGKVAKRVQCSTNLRSPKSYPVERGKENGRGGWRKNPPTTS